MDVKVVMNERRNFINIMYTISLAHIGYSGIDSFLALKAAYVKYWYILTTLYLYRVCVYVIA